ncbi:MAG: ATP-binding protein [Sedimentibacter sp.]|uniref:ATP-binding protein n=1 Tax=Sedimentibacter sp. TaxID=1960295 RepID=UPI00315985AD
MDYRLEKKVHSDLSGVKYIVEDILLNIRDVINENVFFNTKIILYELIINGVMHGNNEDFKKLVNIKVCINKNCITIEVSDEGDGIAYTHKNKGEFDFSESGRGLMLVEGLSDKFSIDGNRVTCIQYIK